MAVGEWEGQVEVFISMVVRKDQGIETGRCDSPGVPAGVGLDSNICFFGVEGL